MVKNVSNSQSYQKRKVPIIPEATTSVACSRLSDTGTAQRKVSSSPYSRPFIRFFPSTLSSFLRHFPQRLDKVATNVGWDYCSFSPFFSGWSSDSDFCSPWNKKHFQSPARYSAWNWVDVGLGCTMGLFWGGKRFLHWLLRREGTGLLKGFLFHLPSLPSLTSSEKPLLCASVCVPADVDFDERFSSNRQFFSRNLRMSRIVLRGNAPSGAQRNHNDDGNEKISETKTLNVQRTFWRFSFSSLHDSRCQSWLKWHCDRRFTI